LTFVGIFSDNNGTATAAVSCLPAARQKDTSQQNQQQQMKYITVQLTELKNTGHGY